MQSRDKGRGREVWRVEPRKAPQRGGTGGIVGGGVIKEDNFALPSLPILNENCD